MAYSLTPSTSAVKVPPDITTNDNNYIQTFVAAELDSTSRPATPAIDCAGLYSMALHFHNTGAKALTAYKIYGGRALDSSGNISAPVDLSSTTTYWVASAAITTLAADARSFFTYKLAGTLPPYIQVYLAAADANKTNMATTVIANYL